MLRWKLAQAEKRISQLERAATHAEVHAEAFKRSVERVRQRVVEPDLDLMNFDPRN